MTVSRGHFQLTPEQRRFRDIVAPYTAIAHYWNWETRCCDETGMDKAMGVFSHVEQIMATFFRNVWSGSDEPESGLIDAVQTLGKDDLTVIIGWARDPFFP